MLVNKAVLNSIPKLYETESVEDKVCHIKLINLMGVGTWYIVEYDSETNEAFGYADLGYYPELGYFSLDELEAYKGPHGIGIVWDMTFKPKLWSEIN